MDYYELRTKFKINFSLTIVLIIVNCFAFLLTLLFSLVFTGGNDTYSLLLLGGEFFPFILKGEVARFVMPIFLHANFIHLFINMWALLSIGQIVEKFYGAKKLLIIYVITGVGGSILSVLAAAIQYFTSSGINPQFAISVGASGAIFGLVGLLLGNSKKQSAYTQQLPINVSTLWIFLAYNLLFGFGVNFLGGSVQIDNFAHLGGFITGFLLGLFLDPIHTSYQSKLKKYIETFLFAICILMVIIAPILQIISIFKNY